MIALEPTNLEVPAGGPEVRLLDARGSGLDEPALREWARELSADAGARYCSRSYREPYGLVAWHDQPVGVDIERIEPFDQLFLESISTPAELKLPFEKVRADEYSASLWSSKEALAKALGDALAYDPRRLDSPISWPDGRSVPWRALSLPAPSGHVAWLCWRSTATQSES